MTTEKIPSIFSFADHSKLFDVLTSMAADGIIVIDEKGKILFYNDACRKLFQHTAKDVLSRNVNILMPEPYHSEHDAYIARYRKTGDARIIGIGREVRGLRKDGTEFPMYLSVGEGAIEGRRVFVGVVHDLSAIREEEERRAESDRQLAQIVESSEDAIISKTLDGTIQTWNAGAERIFGYSRSEMVGRSILAIVPPERHEEEQEIIARIRNGESIHHYETTRFRKDGQEIAVSLSASPIRDSSGSVIGASKISRDITARRRAEERENTLQSELAHVSRVSAVGQLSSALAHELNQPLTAIMNYLSAAKMRLPEVAQSEKIGTLLDRAAGQAERAGAIIQRLRAFLEKREPERASQELNAVLQEAIALGFVGSSDEGVKLVLDLASDLPRVLVDKVQIQQVLVNLIRNASEAMRDSAVRELVISSYPAGPGLVEISVADTGHGISEAIAGQLFEAFITTKEKGMGVGLSICRTIVEAHGGRISASPNQPNGTVFKIQLPVST
ncbi:MAG: PAS domain-containing sensor histidine kinase [Rhizomicrobium sp.]